VITMNVRELLIKSAEVLEQRELIKGQYHSGHVDDPEAVCSYGAMTFAATGQADYPLQKADRFSNRISVVDRAARWLAATIDPEYFSGDDDEFSVITAFNDNTNTTKEMVIAKMREAARSV